MRGIQKRWPITSNLLTPNFSFKYDWERFWKNNLQTFNFLRATTFLTASQSAFVPGDSSINLLTSIYNTFCQAIDQGKEVRVERFYISKAFDKAWIKGLLTKLKSAGVIGNLYDWFAVYLSKRRHRVIISCEKSDWATINAGVPQGSILVPLIFLIYINDIVDNIQSEIKLCRWH